MAIYELDGVAPRVADSAWVAENALVIGDVSLGEHASVWFGTTVRGDTATITIGAGSNIQDGSVLHADDGLPLTIGAHVTVGHQVMLHGCTVGDVSVIVIGDIVLNGASAALPRACPPLVGAGRGQRRAASSLGRKAAPPCESQTRTPSGGGCSTLQPGADMTSVPPIE